MARSSKPTQANTIRKPPTTRGCMRLRSHSNDRRLRLCAPVRCTRKRWASGTSHLAVVNSRCAHGLQEPFSAQPKAMSRLARKIRSRLETSISLNPSYALIRRGNDLPHGAEARYGLHRRFVLARENCDPYEPEYFARQKHKVGGLADCEFFAVRDPP